MAEAHQDGERIARAIAAVLPGGGDQAIDLGRGRYSRVRPEAALVVRPGRRRATGSPSCVASRATVRKTVIGIGTGFFEKAEGASDIAIPNCSYQGHFFEQSRPLSSSR
jgi:hypothetical protein